MFTKKPIEPTDLDRVIYTLRLDMDATDPGSERFDKVSNQYIKLTKLRSETEAPRRVSPDALAMIAANLLGIVIVVSYEHAHVVTSKALGFVSKLK